MFKAIAMYDSLSTQFNHSHAKYRLADIKYRAFADLDNALKQFTDLEKNDKQHDIRFASAIKTLDIMIAQGDLENAMKAIELLKQQNINVKLFVVGNGTMELSLKKYVKEKIFSHKNGPCCAQPLSSAEFWERQAAASREKVRFEVRCVRSKP